MTLHSPLLPSDDACHIGPVPQASMLVQHSIPLLCQVMRLHAWCFCQGTNIHLCVSASTCWCRSFGKGLSCLQALRQGCIKHLRPQLFNDTLALLTREWDSQPNREAFWVRVHEASLQQVSSEEESSSTVSPAEAQAWFKSHAPVRKVRLSLRRVFQTSSLRLKTLVVLSS